VVSSRKELWNVTSRLKTDDDRIIVPFRLKVFVQLLAQPMQLDTNDRVGGGIEIRRATEGLNTNVVLLEFLQFAFEALRAEELE
jgi:hypothetical protein